MAAAIVTVVLSGLFVLQADMMRMLASSTETTNASAHLQTRVEQVRLANWPQLSDPNWVQANLLNTRHGRGREPARPLGDLHGHSVPISLLGRIRAATPPPPFTVTRQADGTLSLDPVGYNYATAAFQPRNAADRPQRDFPGFGAYPHAVAMSGHFTLGDQQMTPHNVIRWEVRPTLARGCRRGCRAFTLVEIMVASTMTATLIICVLFGLISFQHGYASTVEYSAGQADQARLLDLLALDLRRGIQLTGNQTCYTVDTDGQGLKITVADLYYFSPGDLRHLSPLMVTPSYDATTQSAYYNGSGANVAVGGPYPSQVIAYRFNAVGRLDHSHRSLGSRWSPTARAVTAPPRPIVDRHQHGGVPHHHPRPQRTSRATPCITA